MNRQHLTHILTKAVKKPIANNNGINTLLNQSRSMTHQPSNTSSSILLPKSVGVIGAGQMGSGIAYVSAVNAKIPVLIMDPNETQLNAALKNISMCCFEALLTHVSSRCRCF